MEWGILPQYQGHGGNALLHCAMGKTLLEFQQFVHVEMTQVAETAEQMRAELQNLNGIEYKIIVFIEGRSNKEF